MVQGLDKPVFKVTSSILIWTLKVYAWMIVLRITVFWLLPVSRWSWIHLWFEMTDYGLEALQTLVPPLVFSGLYFPDLSILLLLLSFFAAEKIFDF
jgi:hypothetical protein